MILENKTINFLGDSITVGVGTSDEKHSFVRLVEKEAKLKKANNYGISGSRVARQSVLSQMEHDRDFCMRAGEMDTSADIVVVFGGTNDYGHGDAPLGEFADRSIYSFYGACHYLFNSLKWIYRDKPIVVLNPLKRYNENNLRGDGQKNADGEVLLRYKTALEEVASFHGLKVLDLYNNSGIEPQETKNRQKYCPDGLHPNDAGHRIIADMLIKFLEENY